jgi:hypothetical protein
VKKSEKTKKPTNQVGFFTHGLYVVGECKEIQAQQQD